MKEHLNFLKYVKFLKYNLENIEILSSPWIFRMTLIGDVPSYHVAVLITDSHILGKGK